MKKQTTVWLVLAIALSLLVVASSCGGKKADTNAPESTAAAKYSGPTGTVSGVVAFTGTPPAPKKIDSSADPVCGQKNPNLETEDTVVKDGKLANVFVYIKDGTTADGKKVGDFKWDAPATSVQLDQNGCHYHPHVLGVVVNEPISITNSDPTQHNVHFTPKNNPDWNQGQANGAPALVHKLARAEVLVPVKCNQHPWMKAYIAVSKHPFFAITEKDGSYSLKGVPPGKYTVVAWHEGGANGTEQKMDVTVAASGAAKADFTFGGTAMVQPGSWPMLEAITFPTLHNH